MNILETMELIRSRQNDLDGGETVRSILSKGADPYDLMKLFVDGLVCEDEENQLVYSGYIVDGQDQISGTRERMSS